MASLERALRVPRRRTPRRLKVFFLRRLRSCGEVGLAAQAATVPLSTLYRWRARDAIFRRRWDEMLEMRGQLVEDALMALATFGERREVFYRAELVGLRNYRNPRAMILLLHLLDRRKQQAATQDR